MNKNIVLITAIIIALIMTVVFYTAESEAEAIMAAYIQTNNRTQHVNSASKEWTEEVLETVQDIAKSDATSGRPFNPGDYPTDVASVLASVKSKHPQWIFEPVNIDRTLEEFVQAEDSKPYKVTQDDRFKIGRVRWQGGWDAGYENVSLEGLRYYINPSNHLEDESVFQFLSGMYHAESSNESTVQQVVKGTVLENYVKDFLAGSGTKYNAVFMAAKARIESGNGTSSLATTGPAYNFYGWGAYDGQAFAAGQSAAAKLNWYTKEFAISDGARVIGESYVDKGQDTIYFMDFDAITWANTGSIGKQYATNVGDARDKGRVMGKELINLDVPFFFRIPIFRK